jgi:hypothetical protein
MVSVVTMMAASLLEFVTKSGDPQIPQNERSTTTPDSVELYWYDRSSSCPQMIWSCYNAGDQKIFKDFFEASGTHVFAVTVVGHECRASRFFAFDTMTQDSLDRLVRELIPNGLAEA